MRLWWTGPIGPGPIRPPGTPAGGMANGGGGGANDDLE